MEFNTEKIYEGLYSLFEDELIEIGNYISFTENNLKCYSNKIHELHLRVCAEIENVLKIVITNHFIESGNVQNIWNEKKSDFLNQIGDNAIQDYSNLYNLINRKKDKDNFDKLLFGFPDFLFYFSLACEKMNLNQKKVYFLLSLENNSELNTITPFAFERDFNVPKWWTNYNKLKHDKTKNFSNCTFGDLINSLGGLYILMNYLFYYPKDNLPRIEINYWDNAQNRNIWACDYFSYKSKVFKASNSFQTEDLCLTKMPLEIYEKKYQEFYENLNIVFIEDVSLNSMTKLNGIFHVYFDYELGKNIFGSPHYKKHKYCKFNN